MKYAEHTVVFQEVPNEVSLAYAITGCPQRCKGCHSEYLRDPDLGQPLTADVVLNHLQTYHGLLTCVLFMGGDHCPGDLIRLLKLVQSRGLKTCLYTGRTLVSKSILEHLDYLKTGPWVESLGGLGSPKTNQKFINVPTGEDLTRAFYAPINARTSSGKN